MNNTVSISPRLGGCQRGSIRYELVDKALKLYVCDCKECRKQEPGRHSRECSGSGIGYVKKLRVKVKPNARVSSLGEPGAGTVWLAKLKSPPVDGKANREFVALMAKHFACSKDQVSIKSGASGRMKLVQIDGRC